MTTEAFAELRHELTALRAEVATLRRGAAAKHSARPRPRRFLAALLAATFLALVPLGLFAANFQDLNPGSVHNGNINAIADAGITKGCTDAQHYCPNDFVTREQMASFLARTAGLGGNPPVTNALTAVNATNAASAVNAVKLQGYGANDLARVVVATQGADKSTTLGNWLSVADVTVTAPGPGYVLVSGTVTEYVTGGTNYVSSQLYSSATQQASPRTLGYMPDGHRLSLSQSYVFPVAAAGQYTFQLRFKAGGNGLTVTAQEGVITALYVPFGPTGNTP